MPKTSSLVFLLLLTGPALGQELSLFEPVETATDEKPALPQAGAVNQNGQPAYTLRSATRIGDSYTVELVDRQGKATKVKWKQGEHATIPGAGGFTIEDIQQRNVILAQPGNDPCVNAPVKGVNCLDASRSKLGLALAAPVVPAATQAQRGNNGAAPAPGAPQNPFEAAVQAQQAAAAQGQPVPGPPGGFVNPFSGRVEPGNQLTADQQAARDARQRARSDRLNQNQPERIPDAQVPAGMRRVTTPFGDRLVPAGQ